MEVEMQLTCEPSSQAEQLPALHDLLEWKGQVD